VHGLLWAWIALAEPAAADEIAKTAILTAVDDVRRAETFYRRVADAHDRTAPFRGVARQKRRHEARLLRLAEKLGIEVGPAQWKEADVKVPPLRVEACSQAISHELRNVAIYEKALEIWGTRRGRAVWAALHRRARYKHLPLFEGCVRFSEDDDRG
jgi:rubrerythrin